MRLRFPVIAGIVLLLACDAGTAKDIASAGGPGEARPGGLMTAAQLDQFASYYYRNPRPELVASMIESLVPSGLLEGRTTPFVGFFAELFAAHPERKAEWRKLMEQRGPVMRDLMKAAWKQGTPGALLASRGHSIELNEQYWGAFFASGNPAYVRKLAGELPLIDSDSRHLFLAGATAKWSLARNSSAHPLVRPTLETFRAEAGARTGEVIDDVLRQELPLIREEIADIRRTRKFRDRQDAAALRDVRALQDLRILSPGDADFVVGRRPPTVVQLR